MRLKSSGLLWPSLAALPVLALLITLGAWQWQRKTWKDGLQAQINARALAPPVTVAAALAQWSSAGGGEYLRVTAVGNLRHDLERAYYAPGPRRLAWHIYAPLLLPDGRVLWVNRGVVPQEAKTSTAERSAAAPGQQRVSGLIRAPGEKGWFTPENEPARNIWFWRDLAGMHASAFAGAEPVALPFFLEVEPGGAPDVPSGATSAAIPQPGVTRLDLANRHLEYALTWWGLALTLVGVYAAFAWGRLRAG